MRVVVAMDSFKGSLTAREACEAVVRGLEAAAPSAEVVTLPMADGGEGTVETLLGAVGGEWVSAMVTGPLPGSFTSAGFAWLEGSGPGAFVEMAKASGLELLRPEQLDPLRTTTLGTGELMARAVERGARTVWLAIGGSATVDGGTGAARALGWRFVDSRGDDVPLGGGSLERIVRILPPEPPVPGRVAVEVLCDVENPLLGPTGAARIFAPQKGATPEMVERLEAGLANLADLIERDLGRDVRHVAGAGAAGGLGAGAMAFFGGSLVSGVEAVMTAVGLDRALEGADWVVTGEGRFDEQSLHGKVVSGVADRARRHACRVAVLAGSVGIDGNRAADAGIDAVVAAAPAKLGLQDALTRAAELVEVAAARLARDRMIA